MEFWATWCENCEQLLPDDAGGVREVRQAVKFVGVAVSVNQSVKRVKLHVAKHGVPGVQFYDTRGRRDRQVGRAGDVVCRRDRQDGEGGVHRRRRDAGYRGGDAEGERNCELTANCNTPRRQWELSVLSTSKLTESTVNGGSIGHRHLMTP